MTDPGSSYRVKGRRSGIVNYISDYTVEFESRVTDTLPRTSASVCACVCVAVWVLQWITVVPLVTSPELFSNIFFKLSTTKAF